MIKTAIEAGYRYFDTASLFGTERLLGQAFFRSLERLQTEYLDVVLQNCRIRPAVNQVEIHPGYLQEAACAYAKASGILVRRAS